MVHPKRQKNVRFSSYSYFISFLVKLFIYCSHVNFSSATFSCCRIPAYKWNCLLWLIVLKNENYSGSLSTSKIFTKRYILYVGRVLHLPQKEIAAMRKLMQGSVRNFPISIMKKHSPKQNNYCSVPWKTRKTKGTQLKKSNIQWGRRRTLMCRFKTFLVHTKINCYTCLPLRTLFVEPWLMNNKQRVYPTEAWKYHFINSWTSCLIYTWFCNVCVSFLFFNASH